MKLKIILILTALCCSFNANADNNHWGDQGIIGQKCSNIGDTKTTEYKVVCTSTGFTRKYMKTKSLVKCDEVGLGFKKQVKRWVRIKTISQGACE